MNNSRLREILETLDSALANAVDDLESLMSEYDVGDDEEDMETAQDYIDAMEAIRGDINE